MKNNHDNSFLEARFLSVSALNRYISYKFENDVHLQEVFLEGEISNFKQSGRHYYFSLKDENSEISALMFSPHNLSLSFHPQDGMLVQVVGKIQVYEKRGTYSINVRKMAEAGIGLLYQQFLDLKEKLQKEGLFDQDKKLPLPAYPKNIAIITSSTGEAIHDIISTFNRRLPFAKLTLYPSLVQGKDAPSDLVRALREVYLGGYDCLIIGRGGGSFEDLACFNDEQLARTLFASPIPTVSAIGHEGDVTICDFIASYRAPTPTGAAVILSKTKEEVTQKLTQLNTRLNQSFLTFYQSETTRLKQLSTSYGLENFREIIDKFKARAEHIHLRLNNLSPIEQFKIKSEDLTQRQQRMFQAIKTSLEKINTLLMTKQNSLKSELILNPINHHEQKIRFYQDKITNSTINQYKMVNNQFHSLIDKIVILNPLNLMKKGYTIVYQNNQVKASIKELNLIDDLLIQMYDGFVDAKILKINEGEKR